MQIKSSGSKLQNVLRLFWKMRQLTDTHGFRHMNNFGPINVGIKKFYGIFRTRKSFDISQQVPHGPGSSFCIDSRKGPSEVVVFLPEKVAICLQ